MKSAVEADREFEAADHAIKPWLIQSRSGADDQWDV